MPNHEHAQAWSSSHPSIPLPRWSPTPTLPKLEHVFTLEFLSAMVPLLNLRGTMELVLMWRGNMTIPEESSTGVSDSHHNKWKEDYHQKMYAIHLCQMWKDCGLRPIMVGQRHPMAGEYQLGTTKLSILLQVNKTGQAYVKCAGGVIGIDHYWPFTNLESMERK